MAMKSSWRVEVGWVLDHFWNLLKLTDDIATGVNIIKVDNMLFAHSFCPSL